MNCDRMLYPSSIWTMAFAHRLSYKFAGPLHEACFVYVNRSFRTLRPTGVALRTLSDTSDAHVSRPHRKLSAGWLNRRQDPCNSTGVVRRIAPVPDARRPDTTSSTRRRASIRAPRQHYW